MQEKTKKSIVSIIGWAIGLFFLWRIGQVFGFLVFMLVSIIIIIYWTVPAHKDNG